MLVRGCVCFDRGASVMVVRWQVVVVVIVGVTINGEDKVWNFDLVFFRIKLTD